MAERAWTACRCRPNGFLGSPSTSRSTTSLSRRRNAAARLRSRAPRETPREHGQGAVPVALVAAQARFGEGHGCTAACRTRNQDAPGHRPRGGAAGSKDGIATGRYAEGLASEYQDFLRPGVDEKLRRSALKKLFHDPHFNVMDGLDTYIDDYSKPDPIPEEMLKSLKQANRLLFPEEAAEKDRQIEAEAPGKAVADAGTEPADERMAPEPESRPAEDSKPPPKPA